MAKKELIIIADYSDESLLTLEELCRICHVQNEQANDFIAFEIIKPIAQTKNLFSILQLQRMQTALRLQRDLEVNAAGIAVILDLLEELKSLRSHALLLEKHLLQR